MGGRLGANSCIENTAKFATAKIGISQHFAQPPHNVVPIHELPSPIAARLKLGCRAYQPSLKTTGLAASPAMLHWPSAACRTSFVCASGSQACTPCVSPDGWWRDYPTPGPVYTI